MKYSFSKFLKEKVWGMPYWVLLGISVIIPLLLKIINVILHPETASSLKDTGTSLLFTLATVLVVYFFIRRERLGKSKSSTRKLSVILGLLLLPFILYSFYTNYYLYSVPTSAPINKSIWHEFTDIEVGFSVFIPGTLKKSSPTVYIPDVAYPIEATQYESKPHLYVHYAVKQYQLPDDYSIADNKQFLSQRLNESVTKIPGGIVSNSQLLQYGAFDAIEYSYNLGNPIYYYGKCRNILKQRSMYQLCILSKESDYFHNGDFEKYVQSLKFI